MRLNKKIVLVVILALVIALAGTTYIFAEGHGKYKEPANGREGLPSSVKFNPDTNEYYDSNLGEWDSNAQTYRYVEPKITPTPEGYIAPKYSTATLEDWINNHKDSNDPVDVALMKYFEAMPEYYKNHPELGLSSKWEVGGEEGGPLTIVTDLGIKGLPQLLKYVDWQNPWNLTIVAEIAIDEICRTMTPYTGTDDQIVAQWRDAFNNRISNAKSKVDDIAQKLGKDLPVNDEEINNNFAELGVFALPSVYDEVVNKSNTQLVKYLPIILPEKQLNEFNLKTGVADNDTLKKALESCKDDVEVLKTLTAN